MTLSAFTVRDDLAEIMRNWVFYDGPRREEAATWLANHGEDVIALVDAVHGPVLCTSRDPEIVYVPVLKEWYEAVASAAAAFDEEHR